LNEEISKEIVQLLVAKADANRSRTGLTESFIRECLPDMEFNRTEKGAVVLTKQQAVRLIGCEPLMVQIPADLTNSVNNAVARLQEYITNHTGKDALAKLIRSKVTNECLHVLRGNE